MNMSCYLLQYQVNTRDWLRGLARRLDRPGDAASENQRNAQDD